MKWHGWFGIAVVASSLVGCGGVVSTPRDTAATAAPTTPTAVSDSVAGTAACDKWATTAGGGRFSLVAEFDSTMGAVAAWEERLAGAGFRSDLRQYNSTMGATVCYFDGPWAIPVPPPPPASTAPPTPDRDEIIIGADGAVTMGPRAGYHANVPLERP